MKGWVIALCILAIFIDRHTGDNGEKLNKISTQLKTLNLTAAKIVKRKT